MALYYPPSAQEMDSNGDPLSGGKLFFYEVGTSTKKSVYSNKALTIAHTNPVVADSSGRWDPIYMDGAYKVVLTASTDTDPPTSPIETWDNISSGTDTAIFGESVAVTTTTAIDSTYQNKHLRCTGTINLNLLDIATAGEGFVFSMVNDGTGLVTIDPNGSEEINDTTTWVIPPKGSGICIAGTSEWSFIGTMGIVQSLARGDMLTFDSNKRLIRVPGTAAAGDIFYIDSSLDLVRLAKGTTGYILTQAASAPAWALGVAGTALTSASNSIALNLALGFDFTHTFTEDTTLANPSNVTVGQKGRIVFTQHASSPKTLAFGTQYLFAGGVDPGVTASNSAIDVLYYDVISSNQIVCSLVKGFA